MVAIVPLIKKSLQDIPYPLGRAISYWRFDLRPGAGFQYSRKRHEIKSFESWSEEQQKRFILKKIKSTLSAAAELPFYQELWSSTNIEINNIQEFQDLKSLPIVSKDSLREANLANRSRIAVGRYLANTGGTSGSPLGFYITPKMIPNEWAHMHRIWQKLGYRTHDLKLVIGGQNLGSVPLAYDGLRHSLSVNTYAPMEEIISSLRDWVSNAKVAYLHGYPSAISEFGLQLAQFAPEVLENLRLYLKGVFLGSEYPTPHYRRIIEDVFSAASISWYGHTERCVLAWERDEPFVYHPFQTYGFAEAVWSEDLRSWKLVGTSYGNYAAPFVRYDTGDLIEPIEVEGGLLRSFRIKDGRVGDFVTDKAGERISLTALMFGRHHKIFDFANHVQVQQESPGQLTVLVALGENFTNPKFKSLDSYLDLANLNFDIEVIGVEKPFRTSTGKVPLKIPK